MSNCLLSGLPDDPLIDAEVWRYDLVLGTPASADGQTPAVPFDLTGSDLAIVMRTLGNWQAVSTLSTLANWPGRDGTITITDPVNGAVSIVSDPWLRSYRVPIVPGGNLLFQPTVRGDLLRLAQNDANARPEYQGFIQFPLRASTTQWPAPATS